MIRPYRNSLFIALGLVIAACSGEQTADQGVTQEQASSPAAVDAARLDAATSDPSGWMTLGRTYDGQRFSPLNQINADNVKQLSLAWHYDISDAKYEQEATPLVVDGVMYVSTDLSRVKALDAKTGKEIWAFDPEVDGAWLQNVCCGFVNRGVAVWNGKVYVGTLDGRLIAIDAKDGKQIWSAQTFDKTRSYAISGAPIVVKGKVIIGNGGGELDARGYITAYDAETGEQAWRFFTVPGNPADGFENAAMEMAAKTWSGDWWTVGGGGTVWDSFSYDPELNLLYFGTSNGTAWARNYRSPEGRDNLFTSSILAVNPDTGEYVWHFQEVPAEQWDYDACQNIILADLNIDGVDRKVLLHAPKNGYFFVLDRATGKPISIEPFVHVTWSTGYDLTTGRPNFSPSALYDQRGKPTMVAPGPGGGHNWQPMAFSPETGLVYIPSKESAFAFQLDKHYTPRKLSSNIGITMSPVKAVDDDGKPVQMPKTVGSLLAWNPVTQKPAWRADHAIPSAGGILATAGNLVVQGTDGGTLEIYRATDGELLWSSDLQTGTIAAPMSYEVDGEQYIAISVGSGQSSMGTTSSGEPFNLTRVLAFKLGGTDELPAKPTAEVRELPAPPAPTGNPKTVADGEYVFHRFCAGCHGFGAVGGDQFPDLRYSAALGDLDVWSGIVGEGALQTGGMGNFGSELSQAEISDIRDYVISRANETKKP